MADIKAMTSELARDPDSMVFLPLGEALRVRGNLEAAVKVAMAGCERHPNAPDARDLLARVFVDAGNFEAAHEEWQRALALIPRHAGAHKGIAFLLFRLGDLDAALDHLETALAADPADASVVQALRTVRAAAEAQIPPPADERDQASRGAHEEPSGAPPPTPLPSSAPERSRAERSDAFRGLGGGHDGILLADTRGRVLGGVVSDPDQREVGAAVAAYLAGAAQEADRTARLLALGAWRTIAVEGPGGHLHVSQPRDGAYLLVRRDRSVPPGRVALLAQRAAAAARAWLQDADR